MRVGMSRYALPLCQRYTPSSSQPSAADDPAPLVSEFLWSNKTLKQRPGACAAALMAQPQDPSFQVYTMQSLDPENEALAPRNGRPLNVRPRLACVCGGGGGGCVAPGPAQAGRSSGGVADTAAAPLCCEQPHNFGLNDPPPPPPPKKKQVTGVTSTNLNQM
jgi:hypothetical protein